MVAGCALCLPGSSRCSSFRGFGEDWHLWVGRLLWLWLVAPLLLGCVRGRVAGLVGRRRGEWVEQALAKVVLQPWLGPTMASPVGVVHLLGGIVAMALFALPHACRAPGETSDSVARIGNGGALCVALFLGGVAFGVLHRSWGQWLWGCVGFVGVFCGCDGDVEMSLGCGDGLGSRSFRRVRQLSSVGFASSLGSRSRQLRGVMCDDDDLVMGGPVRVGLVRRKLCICSFEARHQNRASWSLAWVADCLAWADASLASTGVGTRSWALVGGRSRQLRRSVCVMTMTSANNFDGNFLFVVCGVSVGGQVGQRVCAVILIAPWTVVTVFARFSV